MNYVVGAIVFSILVGIGFLLLIIPGIYLTVALYFWFVHVAVEDGNWAKAFQKSWDLTRDNQWSLLGLGVIVVIAGGTLVNVILVVATTLSPWAELIANVVVLGAFAVFTWATTARAYVQIDAGDR